MPKSVHITARRPTFEEMEKSLHISKARKRALQNILDELKTKLSTRVEANLSPVEPETRRKRASAA
jgi:sulfur transfer protein SufE